MADDVQPDQGQGAAPYAEYLDKIPEEFRAQVEPVFKEWDGSVTKKFMEAAEFRRQMEPLQPFQNRSPEALQWGADFHDAAMNRPQDVIEWARDYAKEHGLSLAEQQAVEQAVSDEFEDLSAQQFRSQLDPIATQVQALTERFQRQDQEAQQAAAMQQIETQLDAAKEKLGGIYDRDMIAAIAQNKYIQDPEHAIERAAADWQQIVNDKRAAALQEKVDTSAPAAETGGTPDGSVPKISTFEQAAEAVRARLLAQQQQ